MSEQSVQAVIRTAGGPRPAWALAMTVSRAEQDRQAAMRARSYELAVARGHIHR